MKPRKFIKSAMEGAVEGVIASAELVADPLSEDGSLGEAKTVGEIALARTAVIMYDRVGYDYCGVGRSQVEPRVNSAVRKALGALFDGIYEIRDMPETGSSNKDAADSAPAAEAAPESAVLTEVSVKVTGPIDKEALSKAIQEEIRRQNAYICDSHNRLMAKTRAHGVSNTASEPTESVSAAESPAESAPAEEETAVTDSAPASEEAETADSMPAEETTPEKTPAADEDIAADDEPAPSEETETASDAVDAPDAEAVSDEEAVADADPGADVEGASDAEHAPGAEPVTDAKTDPIDDELAPDADASSEAPEADGKPADEDDLGF